MPGLTGIQSFWIPAFAGMTLSELVVLCIVEVKQVRGLWMTAYSLPEG